MNEKENIVLSLFFEFALAIIAYTEELEQQRKFVVANQLLKSGTSIRANIREAQNAESKIDFIHKFKITAKELDETEYWLLLCKEASSYPFDMILLEKLSHLKRVISKIIITSKR